MARWVLGRDGWQREGQDGSSSVDPIASKLAENYILDEPISDDEEENEMSHRGQCTNCMRKGLLLADAKGRCHACHVYIKRAVSHGQGEEEAARFIAERVNRKAKKSALAKPSTKVQKTNKAVKELPSVLRQDLISTLTDNFQKHIAEASAIYTVLTKLRDMGYVSELPKIQMPG